MEKLRSKKVPQNSEEGAKRQRKIPDSAPLIAVLILMIMYFSFASEYFLQVENFRNILANAAVTGIVCIPSTFLIIAGHIDLTVGSAAAVSGMILAQVVNAHGIVIGLLAVLLFGLAFGCFNGVIVTMIGVNSLITTLGGLGFLYGVALLIGNGQTVGMNNFEWLGTAQPVGIPLPVVIFAGLALLGAITLRYTKFGRSIYAIGSNPKCSSCGWNPFESNHLPNIRFIRSGLCSCRCSTHFTALCRISKLWTRFRVTSSYSNCAWRS